MLKSFLFNVTLYDSIILCTVEICHALHDTHLAARMRMLS